MNKSTRISLLTDLTIIAASIVVAVIIVRTGIVSLLAKSAGNLLLGNFIAGIFFTSAFTTPPAIVVLGEIARAQSLLETALVGALGAVIGDLIIFRFLRDRLGEHLKMLLSHSGAFKRTRVLLKLRLFRWLTFLAGGLIIASPLPDELGISLLGFGKMKTSLFIPLSFVFNFLGIVLIGLAARAI